MARERLDPGRAWQLSPQCGIPHVDRSEVHPQRDAARQIAGEHRTPHRSANVTIFGSVEDLFGGAVPADASVFITFVGGDAIGFYTKTENATNDPTLVVRNPLEATNDVIWSY